MRKATVHYTESNAYGCFRACRYYRLEITCKVITSPQIFLTSTLLITKSLTSLHLCISAQSKTLYTRRVLGPFSTSILTPEFSSLLSSKEIKQKIALFFLLLCACLQISISTTTSILDLDLDLDSALPYFIGRSQNTLNLCDRGETGITNSGVGYLNLRRRRRGSRSS